MPTLRRILTDQNVLNRSCRFHGEGHSINWSARLCCRRNELDGRADRGAYRILSGNVEVAALPQQTKESEVFHFGPFRLIVSERLLAKGSEPVAVGGRALDILIALVRRAGEVVSHRELVKRVWADVIVEDSSLRVHIAGLRRALGDGRGGARYITNVSGRGYCFIAAVQRST